MPEVVAHGRRPAVWACGYCHLPDGAGRPENAALAGLPEKGTSHDRWPRFGPASVAVRGTRLTSRRTSCAALPQCRFARGEDRRRATSPGSRRAGARGWSRPSALTRFRPGTGLDSPAAEGGEEPLDERLIEVASDAERHELHDARVEYVAYVPPGSIARGQELAKRGVAGAKNSACSSCHGSKLRGAGPAPPIAGRSPSYLLRQLMGFAASPRSTKEAAPMRAVTGTLTVKDMISAAAYAGSLPP